MAQIPVTGSASEVWEGKAELPSTPVPAGPRWQQGSAVPIGAHHDPAPCRATGFQHPMALLESQAGCDSSAKREKNQNKSEHVFFALPAQLPAPSSSSVIPAGMCLRIPCWLAACCCRLCL